MKTLTKKQFVHQKGYQVSELGNTRIKLSYDQQNKVFRLESVNVLGAGVLIEQTNKYKKAVENFNKLCKIQVGNHNLVNYSEL
jgi:hypothetical protein